MAAATFAQMPGSQKTITFPEGLQGPFSLRAFLASAGINPEERPDASDLSVNGTVTTDLDTPVPDGSTVVLSERVRGA